MKKHYSKNFLKNLLIINALVETDYENPKTAKQIMNEVTEKMKLLGIPDNKKRPSKEEKVSVTVSRHVRDMNQTGLFEIVPHKNKKLGYYNKKVNQKRPFNPEEFAAENELFEPEEFATIAMALYRTPSISTEETQEILNKFENLIESYGSSFNYLMQKKQIKCWAGIRRKPARKVLPVVRELLTAIVDDKQIKFKMYDRNFFNDNKTARFQKAKRENNYFEENVGRDKVYKVSPYFLTWDNDEIYLIGHCFGNDVPEGRRLSHFKVSLIGDLKILDEDREPLTKINEFARYAIPSQASYAEHVTKERIAKINDMIEDSEMNGTEYAELQKFSLDRYMREHVYMSSSPSATIDVRITFPEDFIDTVVTQFNLQQKIDIFQKSNFKTSKEKFYQTLITVQENEGLYQWLMKYADKVTVVSPNKVRDELRKRFANALRNLER